MKLYSYFRSSSAYRVRIALNLKGMDYEIVPVHLVKDGGEQHSNEYRELNPQEMVPTLVHDGVTLTQSLAIIGYLDEIKDEPPFIFGTAAEKAHTRQLALTVGCDIQPLNNLRVLQYLDKHAGISKEQKMAWSVHWSKLGLSAYEALLRQQGLSAGFSIGNQPSVADICLIPQLYNARRINLPLDDYPLCRAIEKNCMALEAFQNAAPESQPDAPSDLEVIHGPLFTGEA